MSLPIDTTSSTVRDPDQPAVFSTQSDIADFLLANASDGTPQAGTPTNASGTSSSPMPGAQPLDRSSSTISGDTAGDALQFPLAIPVGRQALGDVGDTGAFGF